MLILFIDSIRLSREKWYHMWFCRANCVVNLLGQSVHWYGFLVGERRCPVSRTVSLSRDDTELFSSSSSSSSSTPSSRSYSRASLESNSSLHCNINMGSTRTSISVISLSTTHSSLSLVFSVLSLIY